ncbi:MAG: NAD-dependent epimerase/dehydratase family protein [Muribaculaceae bacterium]|nr:NAD-dependent epimerase/dehydratase family protein [Muribaculaceae bacterium]
MITHLCLYTPESDFLLPYIKQALPGVKISTMPVDGSEQAPELAVMISSCDIYGGTEAIDLNEGAPVDETSPWAERERLFGDYCRKNGMKALVLRCADIIGTGMGGYGRMLARAIWRGTFFHFPGNEARRSCIHATDVAALIRSAAERMPEAEGGIYNVTDGEDPTVHDLAEALAFRMRNKRISNLSTVPQQRIFKLLYGRRRCGLYTTTRTFSNERARADFDFHPSAVCQYLRTHIYDDSSL